MPEPYELAIAYDGIDDNYMKMLYDVAEPEIFVPNYKKLPRFALINRALDLSRGDFFMHIENDFYWENPLCFESALNALQLYSDIDYVRFENLPFNEAVFCDYRGVSHDTLAVMKGDAPFQFTFNPHLRREKFPCGRFMEDGFTKMPEQHHNDTYAGTSGCLLADNFRHIGIYDAKGHYKPYYAERFTLRRGERKIDNPLEEFKHFCDNAEYIELFRRYLNNR